MRPLLLLLVALPLVGAAGVGHAAREDFNIDIIAIDLTGRQTNLTHDPAFDGSPAVARGGRIAFVSTRGGNGADLYVMDRDGGNVRRLTTSATDHSGVIWDDALDLSQASWSPALGARAPAWSPDGTRLAYESDIDPYELAGSVTITRLDGSGSVWVKAINHYSYVGPVWSPNGRELAFQASRMDGSPIWIYVMRADGRRLRRLALGQNPSWSPERSNTSIKP